MVVNGYFKSKVYGFESVGFGVGILSLSDLEITINFLSHCPPHLNYVFPFTLGKLLSLLASQ
jgi:hypothetical protein